MYLPIRFPAFISLSCAVWILAMPIPGKAAGVAHPGAGTVEFEAVERQPTRAGQPDFFGTTALKIHRSPLDGKWDRVRTARIPSGTRADAMIAGLRGQSAARKIAIANVWVNRHIRFADDIHRHGAPDVWTPGGATLSSGKGDCEDIAILKKEILEAAGFRPDDLYLSIVRDLVRQEDHAVLVVRLGQGSWVLDNGSDQLRDARAANDYRPIFTFSRDRRWTHGYLRAGPAQALPRTGGGAP